MWIVSRCGPFVKFCEDFCIFSLVSFLKVDVVAPVKASGFCHRIPEVTAVRTSDLMHIFISWVTLKSWDDLMPANTVSLSTCSCYVEILNLSFIATSQKSTTGLYSEPVIQSTSFEHAFWNLLCLVPESFKLPREVKSAHTNFVPISDPFYACCVLYLACPSWLYYSNDA